MVMTEFAIQLTHAQVNAFFLGMGVAVAIEMVLIGMVLIGIRSKK
jgi:hypothetical protein